MKTVAFALLFVSSAFADHVVLQCSPLDAGSNVKKVSINLDGNDLQATVEAVLAGGTAPQALTYDIKVGPRRNGTGNPVGYTGHFFSLLLDHWNGPRTEATLEATVPVRHDETLETLKARLSCEWQ